jgi:ferredoxin
LSEVPLTVVVDRDVCIGSGMCVVYAPATFSQDEEAKAFITDPTGDANDVIRSAVDACPTGALSLASEQS